MALLLFSLAAGALLALSVGYSLLVVYRLWQLFKHYPPEDLVTYREVRRDLLGVSLGLPFWGAFSWLLIVLMAIKVGFRKTVAVNLELARWRPQADRRPPLLIYQGPYR